MLDAQELHDLLSRDSLGEAEEETGKSYKDDEATSFLGLVKHLEIGFEKESALRKANDSYFNMDLQESLTLYYKMGFSGVLYDVFEGGNGEKETFRVLWRQKDGILATLESYREAERNSTHIYYNVLVPDTREFWCRTGSGRMVVDTADRHVWAGSHDAREGVKNHLFRLNEVGSFLPTWEERPNMFGLCTYMETRQRDLDCALITEERVSRLPENVQRAIAGRKDSGRPAEA